MRLRFSCVAFVPPDAQLGVTGSSSFLGKWNPHRCLPLLPYTNVAGGGSEPSLWFTDIELDEETLERVDAHEDDNSNHQPSAEAHATRDSYCRKLIAAITSRADRGPPRGRSPAVSRYASGSAESNEASSLVAAASCRIDHRSPVVSAVLDRHPLKHAEFEYKFIMWNPKKPVTPYVPEMPGEAFSSSTYGSPTCTWRTWLFPPVPAQVSVPPPEGCPVIWEGLGPHSNRKFMFDPLDVIVDECETGELRALYLLKVARFDDPRMRSGSEHDHTARFYNSVKDDGRMHYSRILPNLYVGSCPRQLLHVHQLKDELGVTAIFNLQTSDDIRVNFPDPLSGTRTPEAVSQLYESTGFRYVWMPTEDMSDVCRKLIVAQCALILDALLQNGHSVYVHCNAGVGRSVAAVSAYLCFAIGLDVRKVNFLVCAKRPVAYWDEKAIKTGVLDFEAKFGKGIKKINNS